MAVEISNRGGPYFHGGVPGLEVGDELLPGRETGNGEVPRPLPPIPPSERKEVWVTLSLPIAQWYAARWPGGGDVYEVIIEHPCAPEPGPVPALRMNVSTRSAVVARVVGRGITIDKKNRCVYWADDPTMREPRPPGFVHELRELNQPPRRTDITRHQPIKRKSGLRIVTVRTPRKPDPSHKEGPMTTGEVPYDLSDYLIPARDHGWIVLCEKRCSGKPQRQKAEVVPHPKFSDRLVVKVRCLDCQVGRHSDVSRDELPEIEKEESNA